MRPDFIHDTGIPVARQKTAYEYRLPLREIPAEADPEWQSWLMAYVGLSPHDVHGLICQKLDAVCSQISGLAMEVKKFKPFSMLVFSGAPCVWLQRSVEEHIEMIYLSPDVTTGAVHAALSEFHLESDMVLTEFLQVFGGMGDRRPWESVEFSGRRDRGKVVIDSAAQFFSERRINRTFEQGEAINREIAPWLGGAELLRGEDGLFWFISDSGEVCEYSRDDCEVLGVSKNIADTIKAFLDRSTPTCLFQAAYDGML